MLLWNNHKAFLALVRAGLWEKEVQLLPYGEIDFEGVLQLAFDQSVVGLVTAGLKHVTDVVVPQEMMLQFIGHTIQLESHNNSMNQFIAVLVDKMRHAGIYSLLVKGQGVAQCYERPLWRIAGDIDLLLDNDNYERAKDVLFPIASEVANENKITKHQALVIEEFDVELHGKLPFSMSKRVDKGIERVLKDLFCGGNVRSWDCNGTIVFLPSPDNDVILVFTHFLHHFFIEGVGLRQVCDWCRLLWTYRESLNHELLKERICRMGLMSEWKVFASLAVDTLGMPANAMPMYDARFNGKSTRVLNRIMKCGNFGHNNDLSYRTNYSGFVYKVVALWRRFVEFFGLAFVFPIDAPKFFCTYILNKVK